MVIGANANLLFDQIEVDHFFTMDTKLWKHGIVVKRSGIGLLLYLSCSSAGWRERV